MTRFFNTSGPNFPDENYTVFREPLVKKGLEMVHRRCYFSIWAPRQTGKSTYFLLLKDRLELEGYKVIHLNYENYLGAALSGILREMSRELAKKGLDVPKLETFQDFTDLLKGTPSPNLVLIIDEIEGLNPELFGQFLHSIRNLYHSRREHCLKSVILVGINNVVGVISDNASPFNIADNLAVPFFTPEETRELLEQHERETGQLFEERVKAKISETTANQPGLVNAFAAKLVEECEGKPLIDFAAYLKTEDWFVNVAIDKNMENILSKARIYREFVDGLLFKETKTPFSIQREAIRVLAANGVVERDAEGNVAFKVPLYRKCLHAAFYPHINGEVDKIKAEIWPEAYLLPDGGMNLEKVVADYRAYIVRRGFRPFRDKDAQGNFVGIREAALLYSFEMYMAAFVGVAGGKTYLEPQLNLGQADLVINLAGREHVVETKVFSDVHRFQKGKKQLSYYCRKVGVAEGFYLVFVPTKTELPPPVIESDENVEGVDIRTRLVFYDEERDF